MKKRIIGSIMIIVGIIIFCIPIGWQLYVKQQQKQMLEDLKKQIAENRKSSQNSSEEGEMGKDALLESEEAYEDLELVQGEAAQEELTGGKNKEQTAEEILKYQNLIGIIEIKKINITFAVVEGTERANIRAAIGHMKGTAQPGQEGNCVLAGHRGGIYGKFFKNIDRLENGDAVKLTDSEGAEYIYKVYEQFVVEPSDMSVIKDEKGKTLTLISCEDNGTKRLIVKCRMEEENQAE